MCQGEIEFLCHNEESGFPLFRHVPYHTWLLVSGPVENTILWDVGLDAKILRDK